MATNLRGFTVIELMVTVLIIAILCALTIPQYYKVIEREKVSEAVDLFLVLKGAQDRYNSKYGNFCLSTVAGCPGFDVAIPAMTSFSPAPAFSGGSAGGWTLTLTRNGSPAGYGAYQLTYDVEPNAPPLLTCVPPLPNPCTTDLLPNSN